MNTDTAIALELALILVRTVIEGAILWVLWRRANVVARIAALALKVSWTPVVIDGTLWGAIALFAFMQAYLSSDEAYKYCHPAILFWAKFVIGSIAAVAGSLKAFRSTTYSEHQQAQKLLQKPTINGLPADPPPANLPGVQPPPAQP